MLSNDRQGEIVRAARRAIAALAWLSCGVATAQPPVAFERATLGTRAAEWQFDGAEVTVDDRVTRTGATSLRIVSAEPDGTGRATRRVHAAEIDGNRIRLRGYLKTENIDSGAASLWLRIDGPSGLLYFDAMRDRAVSGTTDWTPYEVHAPLFPDATEITFGAMLRGAGAVWVDDVTLTGLDTAELPAPSSDARRYLLEALALMREHSLVRDSIDWPALTAAALEQARGARTPADAHLAVSYALRRLGDDHSYLSSARLSRTLGETPVSNARTGRQAVAPRAERLPGGFGYVWLPGFAGGRPEHQAAFGQTVQTLIRALDEAGTCGWIVDLRDNRGGNLWPMLIGLGPLLGDGALGASHFPDGRRVEIAYWNGQARYGEYTQLRASEPYRLQAEQPPIAVLLGAATASSAEVLAAGFRGAPNVRSFGAPTSGVGTGTRIFELSDGASLVLAVAATSDRTGRVWNGPIAPDEPVAQDRSQARGTSLVEQRTVAAALDWLAAQPACAAAGRLLGSP